MCNYHQILHPLRSQGCGGEQELYVRSECCLPERLLRRPHRQRGTGKVGSCQVLGKKGSLEAYVKYVSLGLHPAFIGVNGKRPRGQSHTATQFTHSKRAFHP